MKRDDKHKYDDMLELPHHVSRNHPRMSEENRAAQFMPFAALTGYGDMIEERGRLTTQKPELSEWQQEEVNAVLSSLNKGDTVLITWFEADQLKDGGRIRSESCRIIKTDAYHQVLHTDQGMIAFDSILEMEQL
ncbi:MAG: YolD-like family protein [Solobacterium sp.]|nr:YolD-like family protein [Solobacterium sp.]MDO4194328.1 hypothetical protein [Erysipelotrichaceae bacterium]